MKCTIRVDLESRYQSLNLDISLLDISLLDITLFVDPCFKDGNYFTLGRQHNR